MKTKLQTTAGAAVVALVVLAVLVARTGGWGPAGPRIPAAEADAHVGERATVCGEVASTRYVTSVKGEPTFLNLGRPYPDQHFTALVWGGDRPRFGEPPEERFRGRRICVTGRIRSHRGTPQIVVRRPEQIEIVPADGGR